MPEMSLDARIHSAVEACTMSSSNSTTDTASVVSPSCVAHDVDQSSTSTIESSSPLVHLLLRKRLVSTLIRNVKETSMVEAAVTYVKDYNERSPLVRSLSDHVQPFIEKATPMVVSVVDRLDDGIDATTGRIVDESNEIMTGLVTRKDQVKNAVQTTIQNTKSNVYARADAVMKISQDVVTEFRKRRDSLFVEVVRRKDSLMEEIGNLQNRAEIQAALQLPSKSVAYVRTTVHHQIDTVNQKVQFIIAHLYSYKDRAFLIIQNFSENDPRAIQLREIASRQYEAMCLMWTSGRARIDMIWANILSNETVVQLHQQLMDLLVRAQQSFNKGCIATQESTEALVAKVVRTGQDLLSNIPEEKRQAVTQLYVQLCSKIRCSIGDEKTDAMSNYVFESALASWLRKASFAPSA